MEAAAPQDPPVDPQPYTSDHLTDNNNNNNLSNSTAPMDDEGAINEHPSSQQGGAAVVGIRPIFFGNLSHNCLSSDVEHIFRNPVSRGGGGYGEEKEEGMATTNAGEIAPFALERVVSVV